MFKYISFILFIFLIYSCSKTEENLIKSVKTPEIIKLSSCDSINQGLLKNSTDTLRLLNCITISGCDSLRLGILKPFTSDTLRLLSCIKISGCDSLRLGILKPNTLDTLRFLSCIKINRNDSIRLGFLKINIVKDLPADTVTGIGSDGRPISAGKITYYSLENNNQISENESSSSKWDIAFSATKILINGGTSGPGLGGAFVQKGLFEDFLQISNDSTFATDNSNNSIFAIPFGSGKGWYDFNGTTSIITPIPDRVLVIRTATGKFAKLEILSYYKGGKTLSSSSSDIDKLTKQRFYTFKYVFQPNGTKVF